MRLHACAALQFWTPTILAERGVRDLRVLGLASAAPWAVTPWCVSAALDENIAPVHHVGQLSFSLTRSLHVPEEGLHVAAWLPRGAGCVWHPPQLHEEEWPQVALLCPAFLVACWRASSCLALA